MNREPPARHDAMDVRVQSQCLSPGVKHAQAAGLDLKPAVCNVDERLSCGAEQQVVEDAWCVQSEDVEHLGHGEDDVEVGHRKQFGLPGLEPPRARRGAASRTRAVAAGVPLNVLVTAAVTLLPLPAEGGRAACADRTKGLALRGRGPAVAQKGLASSSYDRAEVMLGVHAYRRGVVAAVRTCSIGPIVLPMVAGETCVYVSVVCTSACPRSTCTTRVLVPRSIRCVA